MDSNRSTPNPMSTIKSPFMVQPMSSSYENQWLGADETKVNQIRRRSSQYSDNSRLHETKDGKKKASAKAERRALKEKQHLEKQRHVSSSLNSSKSATSSKANTPVIPSIDATTKNKHQNQQRQQQQQQLTKRSTNTSQKSILNHLELPKRPDTGRNQQLHPTVLTLALLFSQYKIVGSNARCVAVLQTFAKVIEDHQPPSNASFVRHIQKHLDPHIDFLLKVRSMSLNVRECIRWLKSAVADLVAIHPPVADDEARHLLKHQIEHFIHERITMAGIVIAQHALSKIADGDVILTYAKSSVTERIFLEAKKAGKVFRVIVVDSRPLLEGRNVLEKLIHAGIECEYTLISSIYVALKDVTKVFMGAHAILNNGSFYSRIGSAAVAMAATDTQIPVILCCETYKFINRTQVDSLVMNEKGDPDDLVHTDKIKHLNLRKDEAPILNDWKHQPNLNILNLLYDVTPSKYVSLIITEIGIVPYTSAPVIWREYNEEFGKK